MLTKFFTSKFNLSLTASLFLSVLLPLETLASEVSQGVDLTGSNLGYLAITIFVLSPPSPVIAILFGASIGLLWLATVPLTNGIILSFIGPKYMATLSGLCFICHQIGAVLGAWLGGKFFDVYGSYETMWWLSVALGITAFLLTITVKEEPFSVNSEIKT